MNHIMSTDKTVTMNSLEIAELTGKLHGNVMRTIKTLIARGVIAQSQIDLVVNNQSLSANNKTKVYVFSGEQGKRDSIVLIAQLSPEFTAKIVDRWQELEQKNKQLAIPQTYAEALQLAADQAKQLELAAPKVEFVDRYVTADSGSKGFRQVAKLLKANEKEFRAFLSDSKIMYKLGNEWMPYQCHSDAGRFEVKGGVADNDHVYNSALFTPKGINWIAGLWAQHCLKSGDTER